MFTCCSRPLSAAVVAVLVLSLPALWLHADAQASGFQIKENSAQALGRAFAGSAASSGDPAVVVNNPAAMRLLQGTELELDVSWIDLGADFDGAGADALGRPLAGGDGDDAGGLAAVPAFYFSTPLRDDLRLGLSVTAPFGLVTDYDADWIGRYEAIRSELRTIDAGLALSWDVSDRLALGGSLIHQWVDAELSQAIDFGALLSANPAVPPGLFSPQSADGRSTLKGDDRAFGMSLGLLWRMTSGTRVGFSWRSEIEHTLRGKANYDVPANVATLLAIGGVTRFDDSRARVDLTTPMLATLSLHHQASDRLALLADVSFTDWSAFDEIRVRSVNGSPDIVDVQDWRDTWFGSLGAEYRVGESVTLRGGLAYDQSPTKLETRSPRVPDGDRRWLSLGMSWQASESTVVHVGYTHLFTRPARLSDVSVSGSTLEGEIDSRVNLVAVSLRRTF